MRRTIAPAGGSAPSSLLAGLALTAVDHLNAGRHEEAEQQAQLILAQHPNDATALNVVAMVAFKRGAHRDAIALFRRALRSQPDNPYIHFNLAEALRLSRANANAIKHYERASQLKPDFAEAHAQRGESLRARGRVAHAASAYRRALDLRPGLASALNGLGRLLQATGALDEAARHYESAMNVALEGAPGAIAAIFANAGLMRLQRGAPIEGFNALTEAVLLAPEVADFWRLLARSLHHTMVVPDTTAFRNVLLSLLEREDIDPTSIATAIVAVLRADASIADLLTRGALAAEDALSVDLADPALRRFAHEPLLLGLLAAAPLPDVEIELLLTDVRRTLLAAAAQGNFAAHDTLGLTFVVALAQQCFLNEYIYFRGEDEARSLSSLLARISTRRPSAADDWMALATAACFTPLCDLALTEDAFAEAPSPIASLFRQQIDEPAEESAIIADMLASAAARAPGVAVRQSERASAFPRWTRSFGGSPRELRDVLKSAMPHLSVEELPSTQHPRVMVLGCRTGRPIIAALHAYEDASIVAIDDRIENLAYAKRKLRHAGYRDVELRLAGGHELTNTDAQFDLIEAHFVFYKGSDPEAALVSAARMLKPGGFLRFSLYSGLARQSVRRLHEIIDISKMAAAIDEMRNLRRDLMLSPVASAIDVIKNPASDFWASSPCRELMFRADERHFDLIEVGNMLRRIRLDFLGLDLAHPIDLARFRAEHPAPDAQIDFDAWTQFETRHPETFGGGYRIWARKKYARG